MKPRPSIERSGKKIPCLEHRYHASTLESFGGPRAHTRAPSFFHISRDYFETEARYYFLSEAAFFATMIFTATVPLMSAAMAVHHLFRILGTL